MRLIGGYMIREISLGILAVLVGFLALFAFFDLINELEDIGRGGYRLQHAVLYVLLGLPSHVYELMPVAALIGCIYALALFAQNSEFTAMRAAGMSRYLALRSVIGVGVVLAILTALAGEWVAPVAEQLAQRLRLNVLGSSQGGTFRSGIWLKDSVRDSNGQPLRLRFVNIGNLDPGGRLERLEIHEFDPGFRLSSVTRAESATYVPAAAASGGASGWRLTGVEQTRFEIGPGAGGLDVMRAHVDRMAEMNWPSELNPGILAVLSIAPDRMSAWSLWRYTRHLRDNGQNASRYELALWKKIVYPVAIVVMLMLALPFGYLQARAGGIGLKLFLGIMLGVGFYFMNGLFSNLGLLNTWPPWLAVSIPSLVAFALALTMLSRVGRSY
ncbi:MAG: LPS export ABC transporter permease LptG [Lautropia sp.]